MTLEPVFVAGESGLPVQMHQSRQATLGGIDVEWDWVVSGAPAWSTHVALSGIQAQYVQGNALPWIPPNNARWELHWKGEVKESGAILSSVVLEASRDAVLVHGGVNWTSVRPSFRWVTSLQVVNLTNQTYIPTLSLLRNVGIPEPGRNIRLQLTFEW